MHMRKIISLAALSLPLIATAEGGSPWLPIPGELALTLNYSQQSGDEAYIADQKVPIRAITGGASSEYERSTTSVLLSYGISDNLALDAIIGYGDVDAGADSDNGIVDTTIGLSWRLVDEFVQPSAPTVTLHGTYILKGNYDGGRLAALGNDENGYELALLLGKQLTDTVAVSAEVGYQDRSGDIPNARFYSVGASYQIADKWSTSLTYTNKDYSGNLDIGGPGFDPSRFQEVNAERELVKLGLSYAFAYNQGVAVTLGQVIDGRNTVIDDEVFGVSYTYAF